MKRMTSAPATNEPVAAPATRSGEVCTASHTAPAAASRSGTGDDGPGHDAGDDHGGHGGHDGGRDG